MYSLNATLEKQAHNIGHTKQRKCCFQKEAKASRFYIQLEQCTQQTCTDADHQAYFTTLATTVSKNDAATKDS